MAKIISKEASKEVSEDTKEKVKNILDKGGVTVDEWSKFGIRMSGGLSINNSNNGAYLSEERGVFHLHTWGGAWNTKDGKRLVDRAAKILKILSDISNVDSSLVKN